MKSRNLVNYTSYALLIETYITVYRNLRDSK